MIHQAFSTIHLSFHPISRYIYIWASEPYLENPSLQRRLIEEIGIIFYRAGYTHVQIEIDNHVYMIRSQFHYLYEISPR